MLEKGKARGLVVNSGNAPTPSPAARAAKSTALTRARDRRAPGLSRRKEVLLASTGVIGEPLDATKFEGVLQATHERLAPGPWLDAARAIMTTDTFPKVAMASVTRVLRGRGVVIAAWRRARA